MRMAEVDPSDRPIRYENNRIGRLSRKEFNTLDMIEMNDHGKGAEVYDLYFSFGLCWDSTRRRLTDLNKFGLVEFEFVESFKPAHSVTYNTTRHGESEKFTSTMPQRFCDKRLAIGYVKLTAKGRELYDEAMGMIDERAMMLDLAV